MCSSLRCDDDDDDDDYDTRYDDVSCMCWFHVTSDDVWLIKKKKNCIVHDIKNNTIIIGDDSKNIIYIIF